MARPGKADSRPVVGALRGGHPTMADQDRLPEGAAARRPVDRQALKPRIFILTVTIGLEKLSTHCVPKPCVRAKSQSACGSNPGSSGRRARQNPNQMKAQSIPVFAALAVASPLNAATLTWSGSSSGAWNAGTAANWNGVAAVFDNTADAVFDGNTPISTYGTWLGDGNRVVRSLSFSNFATQLEIRLNNNSTTARQLQLASGTGTATIQMASTATAPVIIGALAGTNDNGTFHE